MNARVAMTREVVCITPEDTVRTAHGLMSRFGVRHMPVVSEGKLVGILSDRDILLRANAADGSLHAPLMPAYAAMTSDVITCRPESSIAHVAGLMLDHKIDCVPVTDIEGNLVGLLTSTDLLQLLRQDDTQSKGLPFDFRVHVESMAEA